MIKRIICFVCIFGCLLLFGCAQTTNPDANNNNSSNEESEAVAVTGWECFEEINRIGDSYESISADYHDLTESGHFAGGIELNSGQDFNFAFPELDKESILPDDPCTGMSGTASQLFGYEEGISVGDFATELGLTDRQMMDGCLVFLGDSESGTYFVTIFDVNILDDSDYISPDTWIGIVPYK